MIVVVAFAFAFAFAERAFCVVGVVVVVVDVAVDGIDSRPVYKYLCHSHSCASARSDADGGSVAGGARHGLLPLPPPLVAAAAAVVDDADADACRLNDCVSSMSSFG